MDGKGPQGPLFIVAAAQVFRLHGGFVLPVIGGFGGGIKMMQVAELAFLRNSNPREGVVWQ